MIQRNHKFILSYIEKSYLYIRICNFLSYKFRNILKYFWKYSSSKELQVAQFSIGLSEQQERPRNSSGRFGDGAANGNYSTHSRTFTFFDLRIYCKFFKKKNTPKNTTKPGNIPGLILFFDISDSTVMAGEQKILRPDRTI